VTFLYRPVYAFVCGSEVCLAPEQWPLNWRPKAFSVSVVPAMLYEGILINLYGCQLLHWADLARSRAHEVYVERPFGLRAPDLHLPKMASNCDVTSARCLRESWKSSN
jgi:hypothetical protein